MNSSYNNPFLDKRLQIVMYGIVAAACLFYGVDALREMLDPARSTSVIEVMGATLYYVVTIGRLVVCLSVGIFFAVMAWKTFKNLGE